MKKQLLMLSLQMMACGAALAAVPGTYSAKDYVQTGLVAHWDGREYCAYDVHPAYGGNWVDLIGRRTLTHNNFSSYTTDGVTFGGSSVFWSSCSWGDLSMFDPSEDGVTVEVTVTLTSLTQSGGILTAPAGTGIAIYQSGTKIYLASREKGAQPILSSVFSSVPHVLRLSVGYRNGEVVDGYIFTNGVAVARDTTTGTGPQADAKFYVCRGGVSQGKGTYHAIRVYNRLLTAAEVAQNAKIDACRFAGDPAFEVVSGSVTADGVTYAAGEKVYAARNAAASITAATDAVIRPSVDGLARLAVTGCAVTLAGEANEMLFVESLALGAGATLTLPATGLGLNAATLTADASATVAGTGLLVSAAATSPVALGANVTYRAATGTFEGWPSSGVAYVPVGSAPTITAASEVEGLSAIVFLDDGTAAADETTVSCTATELVTLAAKVGGPGIVSATSGGWLRVTGDNARFRGHFYLNGADLEVANEYGLGSSVSRAAQILRSATSTLVFDNGENVFTNYAKLWINNTVSGAKRAIGSASAAKKLVQAETLEFGTSKDSDTIYLDYNIDLLKGYRSLDASHSHHYLSAANAGACHIYGEMYQEKKSYGWLNRANTHFHQTVYAIGRLIPGSDLMCEAPNVFNGAPLVINSNGKTLDLNGYDQSFSKFCEYGEKSAAETGSATLIVDSASPAAMVLTGNAFTERPQFTGQAGFTHATSAAKTNVFSGVASTSEGELKVASGTLVLKNGFSWVGKKVTVAGGRLVLDSSQAVVGGKACVTFVGEGVLEIRENAMCVVNKLVCDDLVLDEPGDYTVASLKAQGFPIEGPDDFTVKVVRSYDVEWTGWPAIPGSRAVVPQNTTVSIADADVATVAALKAIDIGPGGVVVCTNATIAFTLPKVQGFGTFKIIDSAGVTLANDSSGLLSPGCFVISNTCVTVTGKGGLGGADTAAALVYCCAKDDVLVFTGNGLTNEVALNVWPGSGADGGFILGSPNAGEVFYQKAGFTLKTGNALNFRNVVHFDNGTVSYDAKATAGTHFYAYFIQNALAKEVWLDEDSTLDAYARRCYFHGGLWHLGGTWSSGQIHFDNEAHCVCERADALSGRTWSPYAGVVLDLNGRDQGGVLWAPEYDSSYAGSVVTSAAPAKVSITATSYSTAYDTYAVSYRGKAALTYAPASGKSLTFTTTWVNRFSDTIGPLDVAKGVLVFSDGAGWGGTNVTVRSGATLQVAATSAACAFKPAGRGLSQTDLVIEEGGTLQLDTAADSPVQVRSFVYDGTTLNPGVYVAGQYGLAGTGKLKVRALPGRMGLVLLIR